LRISRGGDRRPTTEPRDGTTHRGHALADFNQAIQVNPKLAAAYYRRGTAYFLKGDLGNALADFNQTIQLNPKMAKVYVGRE
jgi:tetratricopeptide (TPR) repeat protein